jgi:hypothetical protein
MPALPAAPEIEMPLVEQPGSECFGAALLQLP